jgi:hypothetical protein
MGDRAVGVMWGGGSGWVLGLGVGVVGGAMGLGFGVWLVGVGGGEYYQGRLGTKLRKRLPV